MNRATPLHTSNILHKAYIVMRLNTRSSSVSVQLSLQYVDNNACKIIQQLICQQNLNSLTLKHLLVRAINTHVIQPEQTDHKKHPEECKTA